MLKKISPLLLLLFLTLFLLCTNLHASEEPLRFGVFPYKSPKAVIKLFLPIAKELEDALGRPVRLSTAANATLFNQRVMQGDYDLIWTCNSCFVQIIGKINYQAIACGYPSFQGAVIVRKDSSIKNISELKGKKIAGAREESYAGYQFFRNDMQDLGFTTPKDYSVKFLAKLDSIILSVAGRQYDAGVIRLDALESSRLKQVRDQLTVIATSMNIPQFPFAVKPGIPPNVLTQISTVLTGIDTNTPIGSAILNSFRIQGIRTCRNADYEEFNRKVLDPTNQRLNN